MTLPVTLLVEHSPHIRTSLATQLRRGGLQVVEAASADEACGLAEVGRVDVVVATEACADDGGADLGSRLRMTPGAAHLPLVLVTSDAASEDGAPAQATAVVPENCEVEELISVLSRVAATAAGT